MRLPANLRLPLGGLLALGLASALAGCSSSSSGGTTGATTGGHGGSGTTGTLTSDAQTPPEGETALKAWLQMGSYKMWHCDPMPHAARSPSPHGVNRICSNDKLSGASGPPFPQGSAAVKELWSESGDAGVGDGGIVPGMIIGYAVYLKTAADSAAGANWYWYEDNPTLEQPGMVVADGMGSSGPPKDICVSCHTLSGSDTAHQGPGDFVYTQVK